MVSAGDVASTLASVGMAVGPPLVYVDQAVSIIRKKDSSGFSHDVCGVLLIANIIRIFFWLGNRFETPLLVQSILLIVSQLLLLAICLHYRPLPSSPSAEYAPLSPIFDASEARDGAEGGYEARTSLSGGLRGYASPAQPAGAGRPASLRLGSRSPLTAGLLSTGGNGNGGAGGWLGSVKAAAAASRGSAGRPFDFWQWDGLGQYIEFLAGLIVVLGVVQVVFGRWMWYIDALGFIALSIESTLPIPQFISNYKRKTCYGFRSSTLAGWVFGDTFKTTYFFIRSAPIQFKVTAIITVCWDLAVLAQRIVYKAEPPVSARRAYGNEEEDERRGLGFG